jgi:hypothetical protein
VAAREHVQLGVHRSGVERARVLERDRSVVIAVELQDRPFEPAHDLEVVEAVAHEEARHAEQILAIACMLVNVDSSTSAASARSRASAQIAPPPSERPQPRMRARSTPGCAAAQSYAAAIARAIEASDGLPDERP